VLSGRGLGDGPIPRPEESYRLWCVFQCDHEAPRTGLAMTRNGSQEATKNYKFVHHFRYTPPVYTGYDFDPRMIKKGNFHPMTGQEGPKAEQRYSSTLSLTSALDWGGWSTLCSGPQKDSQYPLYRRWGGTGGRSGWKRKNLPPPHSPRMVHCLCHVQVILDHITSLNYYISRLQM
jgi:hypothetical protein